MGQRTGLQEQLFYEFRLDDWVPADHLLRKIDAVLDRVRARLAAGGAVHCELVSETRTQIRC